jgi:hypothetical protein
MIALMLAFVKSHWQTAVIVSLMTSIAATMVFERAEIHHLNTKLERLLAENAALEASNKALVSAIQDQNAAFASLRQEQRARRQKAERGLQQAKLHARWREAIVTRIESEAPDGDECATLKRLLKDFVGSKH